MPAIIGVHPRPPSPRAAARLRAAPPHRMPACTGVHPRPPAPRAAAKCLRMPPGHVSVRRGHRPGGDLRQRIERPSMCRAPRVPRRRGIVLLLLPRLWRDAPPRWAGGGVLQLCLRRWSASELRRRFLTRGAAAEAPSPVRVRGAVRALEGPQHRPRRELLAPEAGPTIEGRECGLELATRGGEAFRFAAPMLLFEGARPGRPNADGQLAGDEGAVFGAELGDVLSATAIDDAEERAHQGAVGGEERVASVVDRPEPGDRSAGDVEETLAARRSLPPRAQAHVETARTQVLDRVTRPMAPAPLPQSGARKQRRRMALEDELGRLPRPPHVRTVRTNEGDRLQRGANPARLLAPGLRQTDRSEQRR